MSCLDYFLCFLFIYLFILSLTTAWNTEVRCEFIYIYIDCLLYFRLYLFRKLLNAIVKFTFISLKNLVQNSSRDISPNIVSSRYYSFGILRNGSYFFWRPETQIERSLF